MNSRGAGELYEILLAIIIVVIVISFYGAQYATAMPVVFMLVGALLIVGGLVTRHSYLAAGGILFMGLALMYSEVVL